MPGWVVSLGLAALVGVLLLLLGSGELVTIFALMFAWFAILGAVCLAVETLVQLVGRGIRGGR